MINKPHGLITLNQKLVQKKNQLFSSVKSNSNNGTLLKKLQCLHKKLNDLYDTTKGQYYTRISNKLMDPIDLFLNSNSFYNSSSYFSGESSN